MCLVLRHCWIKPPTLCIGIFIRWLFSHNILIKRTSWFWFPMVLGSLLSFLILCSFYVLMNVFHVSYSMFILLFCVSLSQLELPGTWFARECKCHAPSLESNQLFYCRKRVWCKDREQEVPVHIMQSRPKSPRCHSGTWHSWASSHVAQDTLLLSGYTGQWSLSLWTPLLSSWLIKQGTKKLQPIPAASRVLRICYPLIIVRPFLACTAVLSLPTQNAIHFRIW